MNKRFRIVLMLAGATAMSAIGATTAQAADLTVRFAWYMPPHTATAKQGNAIAKAIEKMSHGKIDVQTYPSGSLLTQSNIAKGLMNNTVNMAIFGMHWWGKYEPALEWDTIPFLVNDATTLLKALHGPLGTVVNEHLQKHGVKAVGWGFYGYAESYVNTKHAVKVPSDLKGLKLRSEGRLSADFLKTQGAIPEAMDSSEVYTAMQRGSLDGGVSGLSSITSRKWYEVGHYITAIHYVPLVYPTQVNLDWWKGLTKQQQTTITKAVASTEGMAVSDIENEFKADIAMAKKNGNAVYQPTKADLAKWKAAAFPVAKKAYLSTTGKSGQEVLDAVKKALGK